VSCFPPHVKAGLGGLQRLHAKCQCSSWRVELQHVRTAGGTARRAPGALLQRGRAALRGAPGVRAGAAARAAAHLLEAPRHRRPGKAPALQRALTAAAVRAHGHGRAGAPGTGGDDWAVPNTSHRDREQQTLEWRVAALARGDEVALKARLSGGAQQPALLAAGLPGVGRQRGARAARPLPPLHAQAPHAGRPLPVRAPAALAAPLLHRLVVANCKLKHRDVYSFRINPNSIWHLEIHNSFDVDQHNVSKSHILYRNVLCRRQIIFIPVM